MVAAELGGAADAVVVAVVVVLGGVVETVPVAEVASSGVEAGAGFVVLADVFGGTAVAAVVLVEVEVEVEVVGAADAVVGVVAVVAAGASGVVVTSEVVVPGGVAGGDVGTAADVLAPASGVMELADAGTVVSTVAGCEVGA